MITTIPRNHTRRIAQLCERLTHCNAYTLADYFIARPVEPHHAWAALGHGAKLTDNGNGTYAISVHSNHWYELSEGSQPDGCGQCGAEPGEACHFHCTARPGDAPSR